MGLFASNYEQRMDTLAHVMYYPQKPILPPMCHRIFHLDEQPSVVNVVCAIGCFSGYNQEDSYIINQGAIESWDV